MFLRNFIKLLSAAIHELLWWQSTMLRTILPFVSADSNKQIIDKKYAVSFLFLWKEHFFSPIPVRSYTTVKTLAA